MPPERPRKLRPPRLRTGGTTMKIFWALSILALVMLSAAGPALAAEPTSTQPVEELAGLNSLLVMGRITQIDAQSLLVQDTGEAPVRVEVAPDTVSPTNLKIGDQVIIALSQNGKAAVITREQIETEVSLLDESVQDAR